MEQMTAEIGALLDAQGWLITNLANTAAVIYERMEGINWAGFYLLRGGELQLGPFQGKAACLRIPLGRGVCGTAAEQGKTQVVADVHAFPGHIACDTASNSEIVVPIFSGGQVVAVLDIDSPQRNRFGQQERRALEQVVRLLEEIWPEN